MHQVQERRLESEAKNGNVNVELTVAGLNRRWRVYKYQSNGQQQFCPHIDAGFPPSGLANNDTELIWDNNTAQSNIVSRLTVLLYLNDDFEGGQTNFFRPLVETPPAQPPQLIASVQPKTGSCLVFPQGVGEDAVEYARQHWPLHEGAPVTSGSAKYVIRSDILFATTTQERLLEDPQFCYDHLVRGAFLPQGSPVFDQKFLGMLESIYVPHMGVENLGHLLYSLIRFTKKRSIVEIGSGYTSPWILQALADNDAELKRIKELGEQARLLDYPWVDEMALDLCSQEPALLTTIDNCQHQKETATGAVAIAKQMGLNQYLDFVLGDAYEIAKTFDENSIDVLFCDFGVGSRMRDFVRGAWKSLRDGGFLICHSTLTNSRTREWLEAVRSRHTEDRTGLPVGEYVELSLLEPHKYFQNSFSVLQKRKAYEEPIHSEYA